MNESDIQEVQHVGAGVLDENFILDVLVTSTSSTLLSLIIGFFMIWGALRILDKLSGINFKEKVGDLDGTALSIYLGARIVAFAIFVGMGIS